MSGKTVTAWLAATLVLGVLAPGASAAKPTFEVIEIDESFADEFLSEACGVPVTTHAEGKIIRRTMDDTGTGAADVSSINVALTATAGDNTIRFRDVGADVVRIEPDGTATLIIAGQVPFAFTGVLKIDLETGEVILEPQHNTEENLEKACAALTA